MDNIRFILDEDNDILDKLKIKVYDKNLQRDWESLVILLNSLEYQNQNTEKKYNDMVSIFLEEYEEYNNYIDEYSLLKIDILMDLAGKLGIELE